MNAFVALGGNMGDVRATFRRVLREDFERCDLNPQGVSAAYRTRAVVRPGGAQQADYWNAVCRIDTPRLPHAVLDALHEIESRRGRVRTERWAPRTLDLDLLLYGDIQFEDQRLTLPHPRICERAFVLRPLMDLDPQLEIPGVGRTVRDAWDALPNPSSEILEAVPLGEV